MSGNNCSFGSASKYACWIRTTYTEFSRRTLVKKLDFEYNDFKLDKCPVAWGIVCHYQTFRSTTGSPDLNPLAWRSKTRCL